MPLRSGPSLSTSIVSTLLNLTYPLREARDTPPIGYLLTDVPICVTPNATTGLIALVKSCRAEQRDVSLAYSTPQHDLYTGVVCLNARHHRQQNVGRPAFLVVDAVQGRQPDCRCGGILSGVAVHVKPGEITGRDIQPDPVPLHEKI